jgi:hypothetical protein
VEADAIKPARTDTINLLDAARALLVSRWSLPAILLVTFAVYAPTLNDWFVSDDFWWLNASARTPFGSYFVDAWDFRDTQPVPEFFFYRPLYMISFRLCYEVFGLNAVGYHALNVALHLVSICLVWFIARRLLSQPALASALTLVFALHPAYVETVSWISRGNTLMLSVFALTSLLLFMKYLNGGPRALLLYAGSLVTYTMAIVYHPNGLHLVLVLPAYAFLVVKRPEEMLRWRSWLPFLPFWLVSIPWFLIQWHVREAYHVEEGFKLGWHMYAQYGHYFGLSLFPVLPEDWDLLGVGRDFRMELLMVASVVVIGFALLLLERRKWPYLGVFAVWWYVAALALDTTGVLQAAPAQLYIPGLSLAFFLVLVWVWSRAMLEEFAPQVLAVAAKIAPAVLLVVFVAAIGLNLNHQGPDQDRSAVNREFVSQLREMYPSLPQGSTLFIIGVPFNLRVFDTTRVEALVKLYYDDVSAIAINPAQRAAVEANMGPNDHIFQFQR